MKIEFIRANHSNHFMNFHTVFTNRKKAYPERYRLKFVLRISGRDMMILLIRAENIDPSDPVSHL